LVAIADRPEIVREIRRVLRLVASVAPAILVGIVAEKDPQFVAVRSQGHPRREAAGRFAHPPAVPPAVFGIRRAFRAGENVPRLALVLRGRLAQDEPKPAGEEAFGSGRHGFGLAAAAGHAFDVSNDRDPETSVVATARPKERHRTQGGGTSAGNPSIA
jgi:hypothetical protein